MTSNNASTQDAAAAPETIRIGSEDVPVWPEGQEIVCVGQAVRFATFADHPLYHPALKEKVLAQEAVNRRESPPSTRCLGGVKVRRPDQWPDFPEMQLINERAKTLFRKVIGAPEAHVDAMWANIYRKGESIGPHSHRRTIASMLYLLEPGDEDPDCEYSGRFSIVDPRVDVCARLQEGFLTNPYVPPLVEGSLLIFPAQLVHHVSAYFGERPRITLTWNVHGEPVPGSVRDRVQFKDVPTRIMR
jgi:hypothetical protein